MAPRTITINRAPVLTLWAAVVAERLGHSHATALTLGKAVAGLNAQSKGQRLGLFEPPARSSANSAKAAKPKRAVAPEVVTLLGRSIPMMSMPKGACAVVKGVTVTPESVTRYLEQKFGDDLEPAREAMRALAAAHAPAELAERAFALYEKFRPAIPEGVAGWGAKGTLDLAKVKAAAKRR